MWHTLLSWDHSVTFWLYRSGTLSATWQKIFYDVATFFIYLLPIILIVLFWRGGRDRVNSVKIALAVAFSWLVLTTLIGNFLYSHYGFRSRPFATLGIKELFLERPTKSFPSDHATALMAATLAFFAYNYRKTGWLFLIGGAIISSFARVVVGFHWFGDILGGWVVGAIGFWIIWLFDRPLNTILERLFVRRT